MIHQMEGMQGTDMDTSGAPTGLNSSHSSHDETGDAEAEVYDCREYIEQLSAAQRNIPKLVFTEHLSFSIMIYIRV